MLYFQPGCQSPVLRQSFSIASFQLIPFVKISNANCGALWAIIPIVFPLYVFFKSSIKDLTLSSTFFNDSPFGNGILI